MEKIKNIPSLRFPDFKEEWEFKYGNSVFETISNKNHNSDLPILAISQELGAVPREMINYKVSVSDSSIESYKIIEKGDFIISLRSFQGGIEYSNYLGICSPAYIILRPTIEINNIFFKYFFKTDYYISLLCKKLEGIRDGKMISYKYFSEISLPFPNIEEQGKIAVFLTALDGKLYQLKQKKILLEQYKKGVIKQIFSQEIRFKDENGYDYPDWEEKKLGEVLIEKNEKTKASGQHRILSSTVKGLFNQDEYFTKEIASKNNTGYKVLRKFQLVFSPQNLWLGNINVNMDFEIGIVSPSYKIFSFNEKYSLAGYCKYFLLTPKMMFEYEQSSTQGASVVRRNLDLDKFLNIDVELPSIKEQIKIANFLSAIDEKINHCQELIVNTEVWKKGVLQKMFV